jgi:hypothetical protein
VYALGLAISALAEVRPFSPYRTAEVAGMSRYFVVQTLTELVPSGPGEDDVEEHQDVRLVPCEDSRAVCKAILEVRDADGGDWRLFEMVGSRAVSRAVVFKTDGKIPYDVEIS